MGHAVVRVEGLPENPLDAAAHFLTRQLPSIRRDCEDRPELALAITFEPAGHEHKAWRLAAIQSLARELSPARVNGVVGEDPAAIRQAVAYLEDAPGVTGQLLEVTGTLA